MRIGLTLAFVLLCAAYIQCAEISTNKFGSLEVINDSGDVVEKEIYFSDDSLVYDHVARAKHQMDSLEQAKVNLKKMVDRRIDKCEDSTFPPDDDFQFLPVFVGALMNDSQTIQYEGQCFKSLTLKMEHVSSDSVKITIDARKKVSTFCREALFISTTMRHHVEYLFFEKTHKLTFKNMDEDDIIDLNLDGMKTYLFCHGVVDSFISVFNTVKLFLGGLGSNPKWPIIGSHVPEYMEKANVHFVKEALGWEMEKRDVTEVVLDDSEIHDGDFLAVTRLDGLDEIIMWGTGGHIGHSTVAIRIDGELHIIESQDAWYWPKHKIQRNTYKQWVQWAKNCDFHVSVLPLKDEYRAKFNSTAALEWFETVEGMPYGYHNFLFSWIDTEDENYPPTLPKEFIPVAFEMFGELLPGVIETFFLQSMNHRLNTTGLNFKQVVAEAAKRDITMLQLMALPELDGWMYSDGYSYVCSCFVVGVYKAAGLFGDMEVNAVEFTPKDVYQLNIFNDTAVLPEKCKQADPDLPYCQILGKYRMTMPGYSTIEPYSHMNEHCASIAPDYVRPEGC
jgi:hypothetical protein